MDSVFRFLSKMLQGAPTSHTSREEAYLAGSSDLADLERRMREIDQRRAGLGGNGMLLHDLSTYMR